MDRYEQLKAKWMEIAEGEWPEKVFHTDLAGAGKLVIYIESDDSAGGGENAAFFNSIHDFLAFLRFIEIPSRLDYDTIKSYEIRPAESFLDKYSGTRRAGLEALLAEMDTLLRSDGITPGALDRVIEQYNGCFSKFKYASHIHAWGNMARVMASPHVWGLAVERLEDEDTEERAFLDALKELLDNGKFNEKYDRHVRMAREFFEMVMIV